jgi:TrkA domain protein
MADIQETILPGIGVRYALALRGGSQIGIVTRHSGRRELAVYDRRDPDAVKASVELTIEESDALAEVLGGPRVVGIADSHGADVLGLSIDWVELPPDFVPGTVAARAPRKDTGVTVIAIQRGADATPAPGPDDLLEPGDRVALIGRPEAVVATAERLQSGS